MTSSANSTGFPPAPAVLPAQGNASGGTPPPNEAKLRQAAQDFAAVALGEMLSPMFDTIDTSAGLFGGGAGEAAFKPMLISEIAKQIARQGGLGLAEPVYQQMLRMQEARR
jgi:Rod binding domain-containing protein